MNRTNIRLTPAPSCPDCGGRMYLRTPAYGRRPGPNPEWKPFWGCGNYPECGGKLNIRPDGRPEGVPEREWLEAT
jgi:ssDNA-binding Zn-finger/Zn-ribbon topoisomerase 1